MSPSRTVWYHLHLCVLVAQNMRSTVSLDLYYSDNPNIKWTLQFYQNLIIKKTKKNQTTSKATEFSGKKNGFLFEIWSYISQTSKNSSTFFHAAYVFLSWRAQTFGALILCFPETVAWEIKLHVGPTSAMCWLLTRQRTTWSIITWKKTLVWSKNEARVFMIKAASQGESYPCLDYAPTSWRRGLLKPFSLDFQREAPSLTFIFSTRQ